MAARRFFSTQLLRACSPCRSPSLPQKFALHAKSWATTLPGSHRTVKRQFGFVAATLPLEQARECLLSHPAVANCELVGGVAYVVRVEGSACATAIIPGRLERWELEEYLSVKLGLQREALPAVRFVDHLPGTEYQRVSFTLIHMLHALFREMDCNGQGSISLQEFTSFCSKTGLFSNSEKDAVEIFLSARTQPSTSELLFNETDMFGFELPKAETNRMRFYDFQKLMMDSGMVEISSRQGEPGEEVALSSFFIDENVVDLVLKHWFAEYDSYEDGHLNFKDYVRLVADYRLPYATTAEAFRQLSADGHGIDLVGFRQLLEEAKVLRTGTSVVKDDEVGKAWRAIQDTQQFLQQTRVFVADGRQGASPLKAADSLRFVCISDTHGQHREMTWRLPEGDVLVHAGDFSMLGELEEVQDFARWMQSLPFEHKVVIAGNHDLTFDQAYDGPHLGNNTLLTSVRKAFADIFDADDSLVYLQDEECCIKGVRIYGSPWQPEFGQWAFNLPRGAAIAQKWKAIPDGIDILLVHGPPLGRGDACLPSLARTGCADLLTEIQQRIRPAFCVYGHVHEGAGVTFDGVTHFINACSLTEQYDCVHPPFVFDLPVCKSSD